MEEAKSRWESGLQAADLPGFMNFNQLFSYLYCMLASTAVLSRPVLGGAMYIIGQVILLFIRLILPGDFKRLPRKMRLAGIILGAFSGLLSFFILIVYPLAVDLPLLWLVFALAFLVMAMNEWAARINKNGFKKGYTREKRMLRVAEMMLLTAAVAALILFFSQSTQTAWYLLGGYLFCCVFRFITIRRESAEDIPGALSDWALLREDHQLAQVNAYKVYRSVMMVVIIALQVTMIIMFTFIGTTAKSLFSSLLISLVCFILARFLTRLLLQNTLMFKKLETGTTLIFGLLLWLLSLVSFSLHTLGGALSYSYAALALCTGGVTMVSLALESLERDMRDVVHFALGVPQDNALLRAHLALSEYAALLGGMIALVGLALITLLSENRGTYDQLTLTVQPLLLLPALALVFAAIPLAFRVPLDRRVVEKTRTFLRLKESGEINIPLQKQLENLVVKVHKRRYGIKLVILFLKPFFYSRVIGADSIKLDKDISVIFTCNHGELWGPVVTNLFIPFSFRPWVIDEIAVPESSSTYLYNNTIKRQKWLPERLKWPVTRLVSVVLQWMMRSLDSIPVFRDNPKALVNTFRETAAAMEAGDNILIFPENPNDASQAQAGYLREGVGEFFSGFAMTAQIYYQRTGKRARFYPIFADKSRHTLTFGAPTDYDPFNKADEKQRIADYLRGEMLRMAGLPQKEEVKL